MCGICGKVDFSGVIVDESLIAKMCNSMIHRGPDDQGIYVAPFVGLGQRRLSIIDLRSSATAPLCNEDGSVWVVFNGEIYNFQELCRSLTEKGHVFRTATDTEVIVHLYEEYGTECLAKMRGMFAFALWDEKRKMLFAARDRLGKKPFCYTRSSSSFIFGSEIKAITSDPSVTISPDFTAIDQYLTYQYVPSPLTAFEGIRKLPAGHFLICKSDGTLKIERYWQPPECGKTKASAADIQEELTAIITESVRLRMISDVPLGAFLSGGVDSGVIVALMAQQSSKRVKTFTIGFEEADHDERRYARQVAERYNTEHHEFTVRPDAAAVLPLLVRHYNEPFADSSALPTYYVSKLTREHVTVALSGDGGDESFSGYERYGEMLGWARADGIPALAPAINRLGGALERLPHHRVLASAARGLRLLGGNLPQRYLLHMTCVQPQEKRAAYTPYFMTRVTETHEGSRTLPWAQSTDSLDWMMRHDQNFYLPDCLMVKTDIASMASSLEVRCPLLDHKLVEYAATIPSFMKRNSLGGKIIFKNTFESLLPQEVLRKHKSGFGVPLAKWFRRELAGLLRATLLDDTAAKRGLLRQSFLKRMIAEHIDGKKDWSNRLWAFLFLEMWFREFID